MKSNYSKINISNLKNTFYDVKVNKDFTLSKINSKNNQIIQIIKVNPIPKYPFKNLVYRELYSFDNKIHRNDFIIARELSDEDIKKLILNQSITNELKLANDKYKSLNTKDLILGKYYIKKSNSLFILIKDFHDWEKLPEVLIEITQIDINSDSIRFIPYGKDLNSESGCRINKGMSWYLRPFKEKEVDFNKEITKSDLNELSKSINDMLLPINKIIPVNNLSPKKLHFCHICDKF